VALAKRDTFGGTVVTSGRAPTKTFREAAPYLSSFEKHKDVARMVYNAPACTYGDKLAAADTLTRLDPDVLRAMRLSSQADRI
jgi:pyruvate/2-oxoglutarate dehydrogenase complex dihydrolipoamide dehydrogenase (E3) component